MDVTLIITIAYLAIGLVLAILLYHAMYMGRMDDDVHHHIGVITVFVGWGLMVIFLVLYLLPVRLAEYTRYKKYVGMHRKYVMKRLMTC